MIAPLNNDWKNLLSNEMEKDYFKELTHFIENEYTNHQCFPLKKNLFSALNNCAFEDIKVVIIGQDPYHKPNLANGLCFSVNAGMAIPASLQNIYKEIENDLQASTPNHGNLISWAKQGVLLLNATLSVRVHKAGSHQKKGWEQFTDYIIKLISSQKSNVVFMLWGSYAKAKGAQVEKSKHLVLETGHPSPLSANRGLWYGNKHFSQCNRYLEIHKKQPINWATNSYKLF